MCWRMIFHRASDGVCELCERYICWGVKYYFAILPAQPPCQSSSLSVFHSHSAELRLSALWKWKMELVINFPSCGSSEKEWQFWLDDLNVLLFSLPLMSGFCFPFYLSNPPNSIANIIFSQEADVGVEEVSGRVQPRRTVWAHPQNPQSPRVHLQVHRPITHALLPVSVCVPFCWLTIMLIPVQFILGTTIMQIDILDRTQSPVT